MIDDDFDVDFDDDYKDFDDAFDDDYKDFDDDFDYDDEDEYADEDDDEDERSEFHINDSLRYTDDGEWEYPDDTFEL